MSEYGSGILNGRMPNEHKGVLSHAKETSVVPRFESLKVISSSPKSTKMVPGFDPAGTIIVPHYPLISYKGPYLVPYFC